MKSIALRLLEVMRLRGAHPPQSPTQEELHEAELAAKRCETCPSQSLCDEELRAGRADRFRLFCPNAHYIERLRRRDLTFS